MLASVVLGIVATVLVVVYAHTLGGLPPLALAFGWSARDAVFVGAAAVSTFGLALGYLIFLGAMGAHPLTPVAPRWELMAIGLLGQCGILYEEVLFRGYLLTRLQARTGVGWALAISAVLFAVYHVPARGVSFMAASWLLGGVLYGYLYLKSGSLWVSLAAHVLHNLAADLFMYGDNGVSLFRFATPLSGAEKLGQKLLLVLVLLGLAWLLYGRGTGVLEPARRLSWRSAAQPG
jgi:membrane protease YdiL (CAAX protease family)